MSEDQARYSLHKLKQCYLALRAVEIFFIASAIDLLIFAMTHLFSLEFMAQVLLTILFTVSAVAWMIFHYRLHRLENNFFTSFLNKNYPSLNESADLLLIDDEQLPLLQQLQKQKTLERFNSIVPEIKPPHHVFRAMGIFAAGVVVYLGSSSLAPFSTEREISHAKEIRPDKNPSSIFIQSLTVTVSPPQYTNLKTTESNFDLSCVEGSSVKWIATFSAQPKSAKIFFSGSDSSNLTAKSSIQFSFQKEVTESGFYQLQWSDEKKTYRSDFYKIEVVRDQLPKIAIKSLDQFTKLKYADRLSVQLNAELNDDYGLSDAQIIATVSKGSGEGIKFREEKLRFDSPSKFSGKNQKATRMIDLKKMGLDPGDELYFYVEAWDNKTPVPNRNRTETFFIALQDTAKEITSVDSGLGVDLLPEYFRSQRQIIIDSEKLLRDKKSIPKTQFNSTSNELGYDQKVLRLRYGQFLGEEDEAGISQPDHHDEEEQDVTKQFGHQHDTKNEHNLVEEKKHGHETKDENEKEDPLKEFVHQHDNSEEATFFIQSLKTKLKAAITQMWDAELYLRLYQPEKSLPYQYKALNLLKEISSDSRIFVHRSGFDPPPLKEEKRLTGDLSEIKTNRDFYKIKSEEKWIGIRSALLVVEAMIVSKTNSVSKENEKTFLKAGQELASLAVEQPVVYLRGLSILKSLNEKPTEANEKMLTALRAILSKAIPGQASNPVQQKLAQHSLNQEFLQNLEQLKHE